MRKTLLTAILSIFCITVFAQLSPINIGIHGGVTNTNIDTKSLGSSIENIRTNAKNGFMLGAFARINFGKWYFSPALNYTERKTEAQFTISNSNNKGVYTKDLKYSTIDIPMLVGYKIIRLPMLRLRAFAGPVASFSVNPLDIGWSGIEGPTKPDIDPKNASWNIKVGAGIDLWKLSLDMDYEKGLTDFKNGDIKAPNMFNITIGLRII